MIGKGDEFIGVTISDKDGAVDSVNETNAAIIILSHKDAGTQRVLWFLHAGLKDVAGIFDTLAERVAQEYISGGMSAVVLAAMFARYGIDVTKAKMPLPDED